MESLSLCRYRCLLCEFDSTTMCAGCSYVVVIDSRIRCSVNLLCVDDLIF